MTLQQLDAAIHDWLSTVQRTTAKDAALATLGDHPVIRQAHLQEAAFETLAAQQAIAGLRKRCRDRTWYRVGDLDIRVVVSCGVDRRGCLETRAARD